MNLIGTVTAPPSPKGEITVQMGSLSTKTKINNLEILVGYKDPEEAKKDTEGGWRLRQNQDVQGGFDFP